MPALDLILAVAAGIAGVAAILENDARYAGVGVLLLAIALVV